MPPDRSYTRALAEALAEAAGPWVRRVTPVRFAGASLKTAWTMAGRTWTPAPPCDAVTLDAMSAPANFAAAAAAMDSPTFLYAIHSFDDETLDATAQEAGLKLFQRNVFSADGLSTENIDRSTQAIDAKSFQDNDISANMLSGCVSVYVRADYDAPTHARTLFLEGHPDWALALLEAVPGAWQEADMLLQARICIEKQLCLVAFAKSSDAIGRLRRFFDAQKHFYNAVFIYPYLHEAYIFHAKAWELLGRHDMAARLLRCIEHVAPEPACANLLDTYAGAPEPSPRPTPPAIEVVDPSQRLLVIPFEELDPGMDILYDGLCTVLGAQNVVDFPWKPLLHGQHPEHASTYPSAFNHPGAAWPLERVTAALERGEFTAVLYADMLQRADREAVRAVMRAADRVPLYIVDQWDDAGDNQAMMLAFLGRDRAAVYFKREFIAGAPYGPNTIPLPMAYPDGRIPDAVDGDRTTPLFWAGQRLFGLRRLYLECAEAMLGLDLDRKYPPAEYAAQLAQARIGLSLFGFGFDTVRYLEVPMHGAMLFAERPPIHYPHNFVDGESAVFFDDLPEFEARLAHLLAHPEQVRAIAQAGRRHAMQHHTASARARQMLVWMRKRGAP